MSSVSGRITQGGSEPDIVVESKDRVKSSRYFTRRAVTSSTLSNPIGDFPFIPRTRAH